MGFSDFLQDTEQRRERMNNPPNIGDSRLPGDSPANSEMDQVDVHVFVADTNDPEHIAFVEDLFTRSLRCGSILSKPGDIYIFSELSNFNKEGDCTLVVKYAEYKFPGSTNRVAVQTADNLGTNAVTNPNTPGYTPESEDFDV
jgi:hypothetical protein